MLFKDIKKRHEEKYIFRVFYINPHIYHFKYFSFFPMCSNYLLVSFPSILNDIIYYFFVRQVC